MIDTFKRKNKVTFHYPLLNLQIKSIMNNSQIRVRRVKHSHKNKRIFDSQGNNISTQEIILPASKQQRNLDRNLERELENSVTFDFRNQSRWIPNLIGPNLNMVKHSSTPLAMKVSQFSHAQENNLSLSQMTNPRFFGNRKHSKETPKNQIGNRSSSLSQKPIKRIQITPMIEMIPKEK